MPRKTGLFRQSTAGGEPVRAFVPAPLPPHDPPLRLDEKSAALHAEALTAIRQLNIAGQMVRSPKWFLYGFVRKEALVSSQIEGSQATLEDVLTYEVTRHAERVADVEEVCNYVHALGYARDEIARPKGLPLSTRLLCQVHKRLMQGVRGADKLPGRIRTSQNWIGGTRPGNAHFVPPPPDELTKALTDLDKWIHTEDPLPPLVRAGLAHLQFETIHPFLDGNGRVGRLLITLLMEHWKILASPLLYLSLAFKQRRDDYYRCLMGVRTAGDWEGWTNFFLECVRDAANDAVRTATRLFSLLDAERQVAVDHPATTVPAMRLFELLPEHPIITLATTINLLDTSKPTASKAIDALQKAGVLHEITGRKRDRVYAFKKYLDVLAEDTQPIGLMHEPTPTRAPSRRTTSAAQVAKKSNRRRKP